MEDKDASSHLRTFVYDLNNRKINRGALFPNRADPTPPQLLDWAKTIA